MKASIIALIFIMLFAGVALARDTYVRGYTKKDGTYVDPHYRSAPNHTPNDNWSTKGNTNPHTGKQGTKRVDPYDQRYDNNYRPRF